MASRDSGKTQASDEIGEKFRTLTVCPETSKNHSKSHLQTAPICEYSAKYFVQALRICRQEFDELMEVVGDPPVTIETVHDEMDFKSNGFKGVLFRLAFSKYICNIKEVDAHTLKLSALVQIFPFKIEPGRHSLADNILRQLDDSFKKELHDFLFSYFDAYVPERLNDVIDDFLSNIVHFCRNHFVSDAEMKAFCDWFESGFQRSSSFDMLKHRNALKHIPRLNYEGAKRYKAFYEAYNKIACFYRQKTLLIPSTEEFRHLLEKNIYDLCSLIDEAFYVNNKIEYVNRFKKYLLFFMYSTLNTDGEESSVFIIDDCLFECAKALKTYRKFGTDPAAIKFEMSLCALVLRRRQPLHDEQINRDWFQIDDRELVKMKRVVESYPKIKTAIILDTIDNERLKYTTIHLRTDDDLVDFYLSQDSRHGIADFLQLIVAASRYKHVEFKNLVIYNAKLGQKTSIKMTPEKQREVYEFIVKHNINDTEPEFSPMERVIWGLEDCFITSNKYTGANRTNNKGK